MNGRPILFREGGAVRKHEETRGGFVQKSRELLRRSKARFRQGLRELLPRECRRLRGGQTGFVEDNDGGSSFLRAEGLQRKKESRKTKDKNNGPEFGHVHFAPDTAKILILTRLYNTPPSTRLTHKVFYASQVCHYPARLKPASWTDWSRKRT